MSAEENKAIVRRLFDELNKGNLDVADEIFADDFVNHNPGPGGKADREGMKQLLADLHSAFPGCRWNVEDMIAEGDRVVYRFTMDGTHEGAYMGIPATGKQVRANAIGILRFAGGRAVERWNIGDALGLLQQLGIIPALG